MLVPAASPDDTVGLLGCAQRMPALSGVLLADARGYFAVCCLLREPIAKGLPVQQQWQGSTATLAVATAAHVWSGGANGRTTS